MVGNRYIWRHQVIHVKRKQSRFLLVHEILNDNRIFKVSASVTVFVASVFFVLPLSVTVGGKLPQNPPPPSDPYNIDVILKGKFKI